MQLDQEVKERLEKVRKEWQSVNELAVKDSMKCAAMAIRTLEDGVKLFLEVGYGECTDFDEQYTVQKAIHSGLFLNSFGLNGVNNANSLYMIAQYWLNKPVPASISTEFCKRLDIFYRNLFDMFTMSDCKHINDSTPELTAKSYGMYENIFEENDGQKEESNTQKQNLKTGMKFYERTNADLLNRFFGTSFRQYMKCSYCKLPDGPVRHMWFVSFNGEIHSGWKNVLSSDGKKIVEEFLGDVKPSNVEFNPAESVRAVFDKYLEDCYGRRVESNGRRVYEFIGVFRYDKNESSAYRRVYKKIADETNQIRVNGEAPNTMRIRKDEEDEKHCWTYEENINFVKYIRDHFVDNNSGLNIDDAVNELYEINCGKIKKSSIKMKIQNIKTLLEDHAIKNTLYCSPLRNYSQDNLSAFKKIFV